MRLSTQTKRPTLLSLAGTPIPSTMQGIDLTSSLNEKRPNRTDFFYEHTFMGSPQIPKVEGVVSPQLKYMLFTEYGYEELYDTRHDPHETTNLAKDTRYVKQLEQMRKRYKALKQAVL
ncbi:sulfatase/phosphatase domain-containing protein [Spirosoma soli]|uniref:Sulfatase/phosphatase domain-containing protein n=1 Tax=Spirosoma soli TaxID=1770529 RepID=A0ABW5M6R3_9BACT